MKIALQEIRAIIGEELGALSEVDDGGISEELDSLIDLLEGEIELIIEQRNLAYMSSVNVHSPDSRSRVISFDVLNDDGNADEISITIAVE